MVQDCIQIYIYIVFVKFFYCFNQFLFCPIFRSDCAFLVKFSQIPQIIGTISYIIFRSSFICWRNPDSADSNFAQMLSIVLKSFPMFSITWQIPFKILYHYSIFHKKFLLFLQFCFKVL